MQTPRRFRTKPITRPKKKPAERRRRLKVQRRRLIARGMDEKQLLKLDSKKIRALLRRPVI